MTVRTEFVDFMRTMVRGDYEENDRIEAALNEEGWDGFPRFLAALFFLAVDQRFGRETEPGEIIKFVADLRADPANSETRIDPEAAETIIRSILDPEVDYDIPMGMIGTIQAVTVLAVLAEEDPTGEELDAFLAEAVQMASREV